MAEDARSKVVFYGGQFQTDVVVVNGGESFSEKGVLNILLARPQPRSLLVLEPVLDWNINLSNVPIRSGNLELPPKMNEQESYVSTLAWSDTDEVLYVGGAFNSFRIRTDDEDNHILRNESRNGTDCNGDDPKALYSPGIAVWVCPDADTDLTQFSSVNGRDGALSHSLHFTPLVEALPSSFFFLHLSLLV
jgi:hypothetical protein